MLRVYLDQAKWIDLANAAQGRPNGARFGDALTVVRAAVDRGLASFPLSAAHYLETCRRADPRSRLALARVMSEISRHHTIAGPQALVPAEVEAALHERFGRPLGPKTAQVFGFGASHAFNNPSLGLDYSFFGFDEPTERRWNRTIQAEGCSALPVLKTGWATDSPSVSRRHFARRIQPSRLPHAVPVADRVRRLPITVPGLPRWLVDSMPGSR
ncbi:MAG TPA: hypothetical protein VGV57_08260 [Thermoleophilaceae bacterium]|nr:hypothetical protein [Thermoleophilaceae bacterium]